MLLDEGFHLVVVIPALNEEATVDTVIRRIPRSMRGCTRLSVIVVDDGSTDSTARLAKEAGAHVVSHPHTQGVGAAFMTGIDAALRFGADVIVNMDADGQFSPEDIPDLIRPIVEQGFGFVTCTRFADPQYVPDMPAIKKWGNRMMCRLVNRVIGRGRFTDVSCGFRAYTRDTALRLNLFGKFTYTQESFIDLAAKGVRMVEIPLRVRGVRQFGESRVASNLVRYASSTLPIILRAMRDTQPLTFFGVISLILFALGLLQAGFVSVWWLATGHTSPWTSLITISLGFLLMATLVGVMSLVADQIGRVKKVQDDILRLHRIEHYRDAITPRRTDVYYSQGTPALCQSDQVLASQPCQDS